MENCSDVQSTNQLILNHNEEREEEKISSEETSHDSIVNDYQENINDKVTVAETKLDFTEMNVPDINGHVSNQENKNGNEKDFGLFPNADLNKKKCTDNDEQEQSLKDQSDIAIYIRENRSNIADKLGKTNQDVTSEDCSSINKECIDDIEVGIADTNMHDNGQDRYSNIDKFDAGSTAITGDSNLSALSNESKNLLDNSDSDLQKSVSNIDCVTAEIRRPQRACVKRFTAMVMELNSSGSENEKKNSNLKGQLDDDSGSEWTGSEPNSISSDSSCENENILTEMSYFELDRPGEMVYGRFVEEDGRLRLKPGTLDVWLNKVQWATWQYEEATRRNLLRRQAQIDDGTFNPNDPEGLFRKPEPDWDSMTPRQCERYDQKLYYKERIERLLWLKKEELILRGSKVLLHLLTPTANEIDVLPCQNILSSIYPVPIQQNMLLKNPSIVEVINEAKHFRIDSISTIAHSIFQRFRSQFAVPWGKPFMEEFFDQGDVFCDKIHQGREEYIANMIQDEEEDLQYSSVRLYNIKVDLMQFFKLFCFQNKI